jgi:hypothetical protein
MPRMRGAQIAELGAPPRVAEIAGEGSLEVSAVALNPLDLAVAAGRFYGGHPPLPYVPGCEAVGRLDGERVYVFGDGRGTLEDGFLVERTDFPRELACPVPDGLDDGIAAACGIAGIAGWLPLAERAPVRADDSVVVLGATGTAGSVAVQAARLLGAARVVAAGRHQQRLEHATARTAGRASAKRSRFRITALGSRRWKLCSARGLVELGRLRSAEPRMPTTVAEVEALNWSEMKFVFAISYAQAIGAFVDQGEEALRSELERWEPDVRATVASALAEVA